MRRAIGVLGEEHIDMLAKLVGRDFYLTTQALDKEVHRNKLTLDWNRARKWQKLCAN